ncbi:MAG: T9SS type A sorting domain-containing protein [Aureispira sp.]
MKTLTTTLVLLLSIVLTVATQAQTVNSVNMPTPQNLSVNALNIQESTIYFGATPSNRRSKVVVFVHGFSDLATGWLDGNDMYEEAYNEKYRTAFVAMTRGGGMEVNGSILARALDIITERYGVKDVVIVAHSNGGKASEVAMIDYNRKNKVERVITLGTPYKGTYLANVAQWPGASIIGNLVGLGGGLSTSTTYYMANRRNQLDNNSRNQPGKFVTHAGWGYNALTLSGVALTPSGGILNAAGGGCGSGGNDGVTTYQSSLRSGSRVQWAGRSTCWPRLGWTQAYGLNYINHLDINSSRYVWTTVKNAIAAPLSSLRMTPDAAPTDQTLTSRMQMLLSEESNVSFVVEPNLRKLDLILVRKNETSNYTLEQQLANGQWVEVAFDWSNTEITKGMVASYAEQVDLSSLDAGRYRLQSNSEFVGIINQEKGVELNFDNNNILFNGEVPSFKAWIDRAEDYDLSKMTLKAVITLKNDVKGNKVEEVTYIEDFKVNEYGEAVLNPTQHLAEGVYNMAIQAEHPDFQRTLVAGFVVNEAAPKTNRDALTGVQLLETFPNPAVSTLSLRINNQEAAQLSLYDVQGRLVHQEQINNTGAQQITWNLEQLSIGQGTYFVELAEGDKKTTKSVVVAK